MQCECSDQWHPREATLKVHTVKNVRYLGMILVIHHYLKNINYCRYWLYWFPCFINLKISSLLSFLPNQKRTNTKEAVLSSIPARSKKVLDIIIHFNSTRSWFYLLVGDYVPVTYLLEITFLIVFTCWRLLSWFYIFVVPDRVKFLFGYLIAPISLYLNLNLSIVVLKSKLSKSCAESWSAILFFA